MHRANNSGQFYEGQQYMVKAVDESLSYLRIENDFKIRTLVCGCCYYYYHLSCDFACVRLELLRYCSPDYIRDIDKVFDDHGSTIEQDDYDICSI